MAAAPVFLQHPSSLAHDTGRHPEQPARMVAIERELAGRGWLGYERVLSPPAARAQLTAVHAERHVDAIHRLAAAGGGQIDLDTIVSAGSFEAALHAAGGAVELVNRLLSGSAPTGFSAHRPPGHHATPTRAMGFCLFHNVAVAARHALDAHGLERVMILDWDVHHGNGTSDVFHATSEVLFVSIHQWPLYPGTGGPDDAGEGDGAGFTVNLLVPGGTGDEDYVSLVDHVVAPLTAAYEPQLVLISAGFDAHRDDPLADCRVTEDGYAAMTASMRLVCGELGVPLGGVLEGGYALGALASSVAVTLAALAPPDEAQSEPDEAWLPSAVTPFAEEAIQRLSPWWPVL
ncbi:MAG: histone deacetylase family protein [Solirubrobacteraceae bacterium]